MNPNRKRDLLDLDLDPDLDQAQEISSGGD